MVISMPHSSHTYKKYIQIHREKYKNNIYIYIYYIILYCIVLYYILHIIYIYIFLYLCTDIVCMRIGRQVGFQVILWPPARRQPRAARRGEPQSAARRGLGSQSPSGNLGAGPYSGFQGLGVPCKQDSAVQGLLMMSIGTPDFLQYWEDHDVSWDT